MSGGPGRGRLADLAAYDAWYATPRGRWIGATEYALLRRLLAARPGETLLDAGCGTGHFTRRLQADGHAVVGIDLDPAAAAYARASAAPPLACAAADLQALPFAAARFDHALAVTSLCFVADQRRAVAELVRVARRRVVLGLLNRDSLLWRRKGRGGGQGAYAGAHWHTPAEARALFDGLPVRSLAVATAIALPDGGLLARGVERLWPQALPWGAFLAVAATLQV